MPRFRDDWTAFAASRPIPVEGGIATSRQRGAMAESWWSQRFVAVLESYGLGGRMQRGRRYARTGQVATFAVQPGRLAALVQGSRSTPYAVEIEVDQPGEAQWSALDGAFRARVGLAARLLAGEVPPDLEAVFDDVGVSLFPRRWRDLTATCSCPDDANPCKHIAAVLYVFADQLDSDPWLLLAWRGRTREQLLGRLAVSGPASAPARDGLPPWWPLTPGRATAATRRGAAAAPGRAAATQPGRATAVNWGAATATDPGRAATNPGRSTAANPGRPAIPVPIPPDPPDRVLARLAPFESAVMGPELVDLLRPAYEAMRDQDSAGRDEIA